MISEKRRLNTFNIWPGFVDVLATLLIVTIFAIMISIVTQLYFNDLIGKKKSQIVELDSEIVKIGELLALEKSNNIKLKEEKVKLKSKITNLENQVSLLSDEKRKTKLQLEISQSKVFSLDEINKSLLAELNRKNNKISDYKTNLDNVKNKLFLKNTSIDVLKQNLIELNEQINQLKVLLDESEDRDRKNQIQIKNLGKKLNLALAGKVQELSEFQSIFLKKIKKVIGNRNDVIISGDRFIFPSEIFFKIASDEIDEVGSLELKKIAKSLKEVAKIIPKEIDWVLRIDGHTDKRPIANSVFPSNWHLSSARAIKIINILISEGIPPNRLMAGGFGEYSPLIDKNTEDAYAKNRRIEIKLTNR